ncbi:cytochrome P450 [Mycena crocata]|nr:cytochrome P450 [Mycena crocata]
MISQFLLPIIGTLLGYVLFHLAQFLYHDVTSPLRNIVGPKSPSFVLGNFKQISDDALLMDKWRREFGPIFQFKRLFSVRELHTADTKAISHIITHSDVYQKLPIAPYSVKQFMGEGILTAELGEHKRQRRILNPAFGVAHIRQMTEVFVEEAAKLRDFWDAEITGGDTKQHTIDVLSWMRKLTLDVIGKAGFNYQFHSMENRPNDLSEVLSQLFQSPTSQRDRMFRLFQAMVPILRIIPVPGDQLFYKARSRMFGIGREIVEKNKLACKESMEADKPFSGRRDLLSLLLKANLATDIPDHQRLSNDEVIGQIPTFVIAGHETTSTAIAWALHALSTHRGVQKKLREEILGVSTDNPTMDELNALPYLENVVRETMRVHSPLVFTERMAMENDILPLGKPYIDKEGKIHDSLPIPKGQIVHIPILAVNTDTGIWGKDAAEFKPERWEHIPEAASSVPGVWSNLLTFFAGPHNCIGFRFSLVEQKAILFTLIRAFKFETAVPEGGIGRSSTPLQRPVVLTDSGMKSQMPLIVKRREL